MRILACVALVLAFCSSAFAQSYKIVKVEATAVGSNDANSKDAEDLTKSHAIAVIGFLVGGPLGAGYGIAVENSRNGAEAPPLYWITVVGGQSYYTTHEYKVGDEFDPDAANE